MQQLTHKGSHSSDDMSQLGEDDPVHEAQRLLLAVLSPHSGTLQALLQCCTKGAMVEEYHWL